MRDTSHVRTRNELAGLLEHEIATGNMVPGTLLPSERLLAETYGLSRSMVREALRTLAERRLIEVLPGRGSVVRQATVEDAVARLGEIFDHRQVTARSLIEARAMAEGTAAALSADRASEADIAAIHDALLAFDRAASLLARVRADLAFHLGIVHAAQNPLVETMFRAIQPYTVELMFRSLTDDSVARESVPYHPRIYDAILRRDPDRAERAMRAHLAVGLTAYGDDLDRNLGLVTQQSLQRLANSSVTLQDLLDLSGVPAPDVPENTATIARRQAGSRPTTRRGEGR